MATIRFPIPDKCGGGDFVMRKTRCGEYEEGLKASAQAPSGQAGVVALDSQALLICASLVKYRGLEVPKGGKERDAWWGDLNCDEREFLIGIHDRLNGVKTDVIDDFFAKGEVIP